MSTLILSPRPNYYPFGSSLNTRSFSAGSAFRFGFNNQESDNEIFAGALHFTYRISDSRLGKFLSIDPLVSNFPWNSSYAFCENRLIDGREMAGLEVVLVNRVRDPNIYNVGINNKDNSAVHIYAHGSPSNIDIGDDKWSNKPEDFKAILEKSDVYNNSNSTDKLVVILHSCRVGRSYFDENGNYVPSVAEHLSNSFPNMTIIAPDERDYFGKYGELGPIQIKFPENKRADYSKVKSHERSDLMGHWNIFQGGKWIGQYDSDYDANKAPTLWDNKFNYREVKVNIKGIVTAENLNIRSSAALGNNIIGTIKSGTLVNFTGKTKGSWTEISISSGGNGWVSNKYVKKNIGISIDDKKKN